MRKNNEFKSRHDHLNRKKSTLSLEELKRDVASLKQELIGSWTDRYK